jgi:hypothetical protein
MRRQLTSRIRSLPASAIAWGDTVKSASMWVLVVATLLISGSGLARADDDDLASWSLLFANHDFDDRWAVSLQVEARFRDDISESDELVVKPAGYFRFNKWLQLAAGYKHIQKHEAPDEDDAWQEILLRHQMSRVGVTHQVRLEERFIENISGVIPRLRYLVHLEVPLTERFYLGFSEAARFNTTGKGEGPVTGFEQNRIYGGVGFRAGKYARIELGYLWRFERKRQVPNKSDHVIRFQLLFDTNPES